MQFPRNPPPGAGESGSSKGPVPGHVDRSVESASGGGNRAAGNACFSIGNNGAKRRHTFDAKLQSVEGDVSNRVDRQDARSQMTPWRSGCKNHATTSNRGPGQRTSTFVWRPRANTGHKRPMAPVSLFGHLRGEAKGSSKTDSAEPCPDADLHCGHDALWPCLHGSRGTARPRARSAQASYSVPAHVLANTRRVGASWNVHGSSGFRRLLVVLGL